MAWHRPDDKPLSEPMMVISLTHICVTLPLSLPVQALLSKWWVSVKPSARQSSTTFYMAVPSQSAGDEYLCQITKLHPLQEILWADLVLGCDTAHPSNHNSVIALREVRIVVVWCPRLHYAWYPWLMNCKLFRWKWWGISRRWWWAGARWMCPMRHGILW